LKKIAAEKTGTFPGHRDCIYALAKSATPYSFYTGAAEGFVVEWNYMEPADGKLLIKSPDPVYSMLLLEEDNKFLLGSSKGNIFVMDLESRREIKNVEAHAGSIFSMKEVPGSGTFISAGGDGTVGIWDTTDFSLMLRLSLADKSARVIALNPKGGQFAIGLSDYSVRIFDMGSYSLVKTIHAHDNSVFALSWSPDGKYLLSGGRDANLKIWDVMNDYSLFNSIPAHLLHIYSIAYNKDATLFATCSMDKTIKIWDAEDFELLKVLDKDRHMGHTSCINSIFWADREHLISCSDDKTAMSWKIQLLG
jgi:hypothetical protein